MSKNNLLLLILSLLLAVSAVGQAVYGSITGTLQTLREPWFRSARRNT